ncbi:alkaline phosphatase family protein [Nocardia otitidiscaviarum]|uniref:alkaline phosphatase family protein n=1 Tax=Nocardia otitidiscaviarum TaxID=1823 RepID=UPI001893E90F|nr:alkaline phosphatase family protein [Nocardia otitidiscaviarum]MBF6182696.1 alkaline phosphatase family protein [Nocardia otitidiscaviarum]
MSRRLLAAAALAALPLAAAAPATAAPTANKVVVIGIDGTLWSEVRAANAPNLGRLAAEGTLARTSIAPHTTMSCVSWATALTGVWDTKHGIQDNGSTCNPTPFASYPTVFTQVERTRPHLSTASIGTWDTIGMIARTGDPRADRVEVTQLDPTGAGICETTADANATAGVVSAVEDGTDLVFTHLDQVDIVGHTLRDIWPQAYRDAIGRADALVGKITAAVDARAAAHPDEQWTILVTTDHGHTPDGGHGGQSAYETASFVIARGAGFAAGAEYNGYTLADITPTVLDLLDIPAPGNLDGTSMLSGGSGDPSAPVPDTPPVGSGITGSSSGSAQAAMVNNPLCILGSGSASGSASGSFDK